MMCFGKLLRLGAGAFAALATCLTEARAEAPSPAEAEPSGPLVQVVAEVLMGGEHFPWVLKLQNVSDVPVRIVTDSRLLWFVSTPSGEKKPITCRLPADMFPDNPYPPSVLEFEPNEFIVRTFDPRFYCFDKKEREAFAPGTELVPMFGWPDETKTLWRRGKRVEEVLPAEPPFVAEAVAAESTLRPRRNVAGATFTMSDRYADWVQGNEDEDQDESDDDDFSMRVLGPIDAHSEHSAIATVEFANNSSETVVFFLRRELITFEVMGPDGVVRCQALPDERYPQRNAFIHLKPRKTMRLASRLVELCPAGTFARPGFYLINAEYDAVNAGRKFGLDAFVGTLRNDEPVLLRIHTGELPFRLTPRDPEPPPAKMDDDDRRDAPPEHRLKHRRHRERDRKGRPPRRTPRRKG